MSGALSFAFVAGTVATVNPCGFALLPAYLARRLGAEERARGAAGGVARALVVGCATSLGFLLVFGAVGTTISLGARSLTRALPWAGLAIGVVLAVAGVAALSGRHVGLRIPALRVRAGGDGVLGDLVFGLGYGTASLSCALPVFLAATGTALTGSVLGSALGFLAYGAGMGTVLTALAVAAALSRSGVALGLRRLLPYLPRLSGVLLLLAGGYVVYYWGFFLLPGATTRTTGLGVITQGELVSSRLASWLGGSGQTALVALFAAFVLAALCVLAWRVTASARAARASADET
ncbi:MAG TPA: cytochrome c biogenesis protein CcdA [Gaiellaceae bacterium]|nr:cytochrome c biogenesis protein CcdA [Gaiellaceae bacterium]